MEDNDIYKSILCPITFELMEDPVMASDGHTYDKKAIEEWFNKGKQTSPMTGKKLQNKNLLVNYSIKSIIDNYKKNPFSICFVNKRFRGK